MNCVSGQFKYHASSHSSQKAFAGTVNGKIQKASFADVSRNYTGNVYCQYAEIFLLNIIR
jgi:hypothetical protein